MRQLAPVSYLQHKILYAWKPAYIAADPNNSEEEVTFV